MLNIATYYTIQYTTWSDWRAIESYESEEGKKLGKTAEKVTDVSKMLDIITAARRKWFKSVNE